MGFFDFVKKAALPVVGMNKALGKAVGISGLNGTQTSTSTIKLGKQSALEKQAQAQVAADYAAMQGLVNAGPGQMDVASALTSQRDLASMLEQYSTGGFLPTQSDFTAANDFTRQAYAGQQTALNQTFADQEIQNSRQAALMGRTGDDPVLRNMLARSQGQMQQQLSADMTSFGAQYAQALPGQRLGYAQNAAELRSGLASQAMANRQAILGLGSTLQNNERNFRLSTAARSNTQSSTPGLLDIASLGASIAGMAMGMPSLGGLGGAKSGQQAAPAPQAGMQTPFSPIPSPAAAGMAFGSQIQQPFNMTANLSAAPLVGSNPYSSAGFGVPRQGYGFSGSW